MPAHPSPEVARLWRSRWAPSSNSLRDYGAIIDAAVLDRPAIVAATSDELAVARSNLAAFVAWLKEQIVTRGWVRSKRRRLAVDLAVLTAGVVATLTAPITLLGAAAVGGSCAFLYTTSEISASKRRFSGEWPTF